MAARDCIDAETRRVLRLHAGTAAIAAVPHLDASLPPRRIRGRGRSRLPRLRVRLRAVMVSSYVANRRISLK